MGAPDGMVAVSTVGREEMCELRFIIQAMASVLPDRPKGPGPFTLSVPGALEDLVKSAGPDVIGEGAVEVPFTYRHASPKAGARTALPGRFRQPCDAWARTRPRMP